MQTADYLLLLDINDRALGLQVPAKLFEYIQIGRPILAFTGRHSPVERILEQSGIPHACIHPDDPTQAVDERVLKVLCMSKRPVQPSQWFKEMFDGCEAETRVLYRDFRCRAFEGGQKGNPCITGMKSPSYRPSESS